MSFKERLEELKAAHKAGLMDENAFQNAKQKLFNELKTGVVESDGEWAETPDGSVDDREGEVVQDSFESLLSGQSPVPDAGSPVTDAGDMNFKGRLEQIKVAHRMGLMDEATFQKAKQRLFTELKTGVVKPDAVPKPPPASAPPRKSGPIRSSAKPVSGRPSKRATTRVRQSPGRRTQPVVWALLGILLVGVCIVGLVYLGRRPSSGKTVIPVAIPEPARQRAPAPQAMGLTDGEAQGLQRSAASRLGVTVTLQDSLKDGGLGPQMEVIPAGKFMMGANAEEDGKPDEKAHRVALKAFAISRYPIQFHEYERFANDQGLPAPNDQGWGRGQRPVINVSWLEAERYAAWLSDQTGLRYRLPTEAQWEYAARAGTTTAFYFGSELSTEQANFDGRRTLSRGMPGQFRGQTFPVGQFPGNAWGLFDVHGNVWEWTCSVYLADYAGEEQRCAAQSDGRSRVVRGGGWSSERADVRSAARFSLNAEQQLSVVGFRVVREFPPR